MQTKENMRFRAYSSQAICPKGIFMAGLLEVATVCSGLGYSVHIMSPNVILGFLFLKKRILIHLLIN